MKQFGLTGALCVLLMSQLWGQQLTTQTLKSPDGKYTYTTVQGDPLQTRVYTLTNGLKVYLSVNKAEPKIYTAIPVRAGSKHDPADNTGLAHYLEHMLFKGTDRYGSLNFAKEKVYLDQIEDLYAQYNASKDERQRRQIYHRIDSISGIAALYAIPNEYDKIVGDLGAEGTNAFTSNDLTCYINGIPANQLEKWLQLEAERFRAPIFRLFHTELEAVYEEKNISLDNDNRKAREVLMAELFPTHPYGTQTTIGTVEHLKNPSLKKIRAYYEQYYVPGNMAIMLAGDLDPDRTIALIDSYFGSKPSKPVQQPVFPPMEPLKGPITKTVSGPDKAFVQFAYRIPGTHSPDAPIFELISLILANGEAGLIDVNINQKQKALGAGVQLNILNDYGLMLCLGRPTQGQSLADVAKLIKAEIEKLKKGEFDEKLIPSIILQDKVERLQASQQNSSRVYELLDGFVFGQSRELQLRRKEDLKKITKQDIMRVAQLYFTEGNCVTVYKENGPKTEAVKVPKPSITPIPLNRDTASTFFRDLQLKPSPKIEPAFIDLKTAIQTSTLSNGLSLHYVPNTENELFELYYYYDLGRFHDKSLGLATALADLLGTDKLSNEQLKRAFYDLGCSYGISVADEKTYIYLNGLQESFPAALKLLEQALSNLKADQAVLDQLVKRTLSSRADAKKDKGSISAALNSYAQFGPRNPSNTILTESELKMAKAEEVLAVYRALTQSAHKVLYYGPAKLPELQEVLNTTHAVGQKPVALPNDIRFRRLELKEPKVLFVDYDMVQAQLSWIHRSLGFNAQMQPSVQLFNEYFGGGMSAIVFQTIREAKGLAYSTWARYQTPGKSDDPYYMRAFVGTQADKLHEAAGEMNQLLTKMPMSTSGFDIAKSSMEQTLRAGRTLRMGIILEYLSAQRLGLDYDLSRKVFEALPGLSLNDMQAFHQKYVSGKPYVLLVMGSKQRIKLEDLAKYGPVEEIKLEQLFGY